MEMFPKSLDISTRMWLRNPLNGLSGTKVSSQGALRPAVTRLPRLMAHLPTARSQHPDQRCTLVLRELLVLTDVMVGHSWRSRPLDDSQQGELPVSSAALRDGILAVPVIDISSFRMPYADTAARAEVVRQVDQAARTVGFMQITGHGIAAAALSEFTREADALFALEAQAKPRYRCPPGINRGYTPPKAEALANSLGLVSAADLFEAINVGSTAADFPGLDLPEDVYAANVYPAAEVPGFEAAVSEWFTAAGRVARTMVRIFGGGL